MTEFTLLLLGIGAFALGLIYQAAAHLLTMHRNRTDPHAAANIAYLEEEDRRHREAARLAELTAYYDDINALEAECEIPLSERPDHIT
jgi:hypothetical protein